MGEYPHATVNSLRKIDCKPDIGKKNEGHRKSHLSGKKGRPMKAYLYNNRVKQITKDNKMNIVDVSYIKA